MNALLQSRSLSVAVAVVMFIATLFAALWYAASAAEHGQQVGLFERTKSAAETIGVLQGGGATPNHLPSHPMEVGSLIERLAKESGIQPASILRIVPEAPRPVQDTNAVQVIHEVDLRGLRLLQALSLIDRIGRQEPSLSIQEIRLSAASCNSSDDQWNIDTRIAQIVQHESRADRSALVNSVRKD